MADRGRKVGIGSSVVVDGEIVDESVELVHWLIGHGYAVSDDIQRMIRSRESLRSRKLRGDEEPTVISIPCNGRHSLLPVIIHRVTDVSPILWLVVWIDYLHLEVGFHAGPILKLQHVLALSITLLAVNNTPREVDDHVSVCPVTLFVRAEKCSVAGVMRANPRVHSEIAAEDKVFYGEESLVAKEHTSV